MTTIEPIIATATAIASPSTSTVNPIPKNTLRAESMIAWQSKGRSRICSNYTEDFDFCDTEIKSTMSRKTWTAMDKCFKWQFINDYIASIAWIVEDDVAMVKMLFANNKLPHVIWNAKERRITSLGLNIRNKTI